MSDSRQVSAARLKARQIIRDLRIQSPGEIEIEDIAWTRGALVRETKMDGADGRLVRASDRAIISVRADLPESGRKRFVVAHEVGHLELHLDKGGLNQCIEENFLVWSQRSGEEAEANEFAKELLMPEEMFRPRCEHRQPGFDSIEALASEFRTTLTATALRYLDCTSHRCALVVSKDGMVSWFSRSENFGHWIEPASKLDRNTYAVEFFEGKPTPQGMRSVPAPAWLKDRNFSSTSTIKEESKGLRRYNAVLTILWIDQDVEEPNSEEDSDERDPDHFTPGGKRWRW